VRGGENDVTQIPGYATVSLRAVVAEEDMDAPRMFSAAFVPFNMPS